MMDQDRQTKRQKDRFSRIERQKDRKVKSNKDDEQDTDDHGERGGHTWQLSISVQVLYAKKYMGLKSVEHKST